MTDRRRVNGPPGGTAPPVFASSRAMVNGALAVRKRRTREQKELRKIFLKTGLTPSASGSAYLELEPSSTTITGANALTNNSSSLKLTCTVHGPRPLPRSAPFSPHLLLSTHVKFAPFAARQRRGYVRDTGERDLGAHLDTALRGVLIGERWPKSGLEVVITILEAEGDSTKDNRSGTIVDEDGRASEWSLMSILSGCITVASAAIADAGIDCVDLVSGGVAAIVRQPYETFPEQEHRRSLNGRESIISTETIMDPCPLEHPELVAACVVGYLQSRDEITEIWAKGDISRASSAQSSGQSGLGSLLDQAVETASSARLVLIEAIKESTELKLERSKVNLQEITEPKMEQGAVHL